MKIAIITGISGQDGSYLTPEKKKEYARREYLKGVKISVANKSLWDSRLNSLKLQIDYWLNNPSSKMVEIVQLYYDNF